MSQTFASYNILSGGFTDYSLDLPLPPVRFAKIQEAVSMFHADFVGLIDTFRWERDFTPQLLTDSFGFPFIKSISIDDANREPGNNDTGLTVMTKLPVLDCKIVRLESRNAILTTVEIDQQRLDVFTVYLEYTSEDRRITEIKKLLTLVNPDMSTIIMGDLNTLDPHEQLRIDRLIAGFSKKYPEIIFEIFPKILDMMHGNVIRLLTENGFQDGALIKKATVPTKLMKYPVKQAVVRLDYAFHSKGVEISGLTVPQDPIFDQASDHYPIVFDVEMIK
jgi:endonuclease/exonuclease/phosphatase family metal-dependent hydrolase